MSTPRGHIFKSCHSLLMWCTITLWSFISMLWMLKPLSRPKLSSRDKDSWAYHRTLTTEIHSGHLSNWPQNLPEGAWAWYLSHIGGGRDLQHTQPESSWATLKPSKRPTTAGLTTRPGMLLCGLEMMSFCITLQKLVLSLLLVRIPGWSLFVVWPRDRLAVTLLPLGTVFVGMMKQSMQRRC